MNKKGFTLIELLIVITIIGILTVLGARQFGSVTIKAKVTTDFGNAQLISNAIRQAIYMNDKVGDVLVDYDAGTAESPVQIDAGGDSSVATKIAKYIGTIPKVEALENGHWFVYINKADETVQVSVGTTETVAILSPRQASYEGTVYATE